MLRLKERRHYVYYILYYEDKMLTFYSCGFSALSFFYVLILYFINNFINDLVFILLRELLSE